MSDKRDQASKELLPDGLVNDAGELDDVSTEWNEAEFHDETNDADHLVEDQGLGEAVYERGDVRPGRPGGFAAQPHQPGRPER